MAPIPTDKADEAVEYLVNGTASCAKEAMKFTGKYSITEMKNNNVQGNIRKRAKHSYEDRHQADPNAPTWEAFHANVKRQKLSPVPGAIGQAPQAPPAARAPPGRSRSNSQTSQSSLSNSQTSQQSRGRSRSVSSRGRTSRSNSQESGSQTSQTSGRSRSRSRSKSPVPQSIAMPKDKGFRLTPRQRIQHAAAKKAKKESWNEAVAKATKLYSEQASKPSGERMTSDAVSEEIFNETGFEVPASTIRNMVREGRAGKVPAKRGPKGKMPDGMFEALSDAFVTYIALTQQSAEAELNSIELKEKLRSFLNGALEMNIDHLYDRLTNENADELEGSEEYLMELRRMMWTTDYNLETWHHNWEQFLVKHGFATAEPLMDASTGEAISRITISPEQKRRIVNFDESHISLDGNEGRCGGRPAQVLVVSGLKRSGTPTNKSSTTATFFGGSNAAAEQMPPALLVPTDAQEGNETIPASLVDGLPKVFAQFGHEEKKEFGPIVMANEKGGMNEVAFEKIVMKLVNTLYPDASDVEGKRVIFKVDSGPGRLLKRMLVRLRLRGVYLYPSVPNATSVQQETDQTYGLFQTFLRAALKILTRELFMLNEPLNRCHFPIIINGREANGGKPAIKSAFAHGFAEEKLRDDWEKVGAAPATRACLNDPKVRVENVPQEWKQYLEDADAQLAPGVQVTLSNNNQLVEALTAYETRNTNAVAKLNGMGMGVNGSVFSKKAPDTQQQQLAATEQGSDERIRRLAVVLTSHGKRFVVTGGEPLNSDDFFRALQYKDSLSQHEKDVADNKKAKELYAYQEKAVAVLALGKEVNQLKGKNELEHLIRFGSRLYDENLAFTAILKKPLQAQKSFYVDNLQNLVEDETLRMEEPPESVPLPDVPSLEETLLEQERQSSKNEAMSLVHSAGAQDRTWLEALARSAREKLQELESAEEAKEEQED